MTRPVTLFTGQWADLPLETVAKKAKEFGFDGLELACWGDHFDVARSLADDSYCQGRRDLLAQHGLSAFAISNHLVAQAVCEAIDAVAREVLEAAGFGPDYHLPGLPHRTGHGIGLSIHEAPYLVRGDATPLAVGMCFSHEPMIVVPGAFGIRLEDHFHVTEHGAAWFTEPGLRASPTTTWAPRTLKAAAFIGSRTRTRS